MNYSVNLSSGQTVEVVIGEAAQINVEQALNYIESGRVEITKYVNEWAKPEITNYTNEYAEPIVAEIVNQTTKPLIDDYLNTTTKPQIDEYVTDNVKPYADSAKDSAAKAETSETNAKASELATASSAGVASAAAVTATEAKDYTAKVLTDDNLKTVGQDLQSADSNIKTVATNIVNVNTVSKNMADVRKAVQSANDAKLWAVGTITEKPEGSSKYWAEQAKNAVKTPDATETVKGIVRLATSKEVTAGTNDSAAITPLKLKSKLDTKQDKSTAVNYNNISNCITYIPQDIKLELNNGTLTLKAGSKVYVPNGFESDGTTPKFDVVITERNLDIPKWNNTVPGLISMTANRELWIALPEQQFSGSSAPTTQYALWYDTKNNIIKSSSNAGSSWKEGYCLPIAICTADSSKWTSIDQVFNGFGYIGSTIFALPGVKGLIPNGRNADGSLKSIEVSVGSIDVKTYKNFTLVEYWDVIIYFSGVGLNHVVYDEKNNNILNKSTGNITSQLKVASISFDSNSKITSFTPKTVFHALDYNDSSRIVSIMDTELAKKLNVNARTIGEITDLRTPMLNEGNTSTVYIDGYMINSEDDINGFLVAPVLFADGKIGNRLMARKKINGNNVYKGLTLGITADGSIFTDLEKCNWNNSIVTTTSHGSNYVRFGNGLQICWGYVGSDEQIITFQQPFRDTDYSVMVTGGNTKNEAYPSIVRDESKTSTSVKVYCRYLAKNYIVIGYWY